MVRAAVLLSGRLMSPVAGTEPACVGRYVLSAGETPVVRGTAVSVMFRRLPGQGRTQSCTQHRTVVPEHARAEALRICQYAKAYGTLKVLGGPGGTAST